MNGLQFGNDEDVNVAGGDAVLEMQGNSFTDVAVKFVDGFALGEDVFTDSAGAPRFAIAIHFHFDQRAVILHRLSDSRIRRLVNHAGNST